MATLGDLVVNLSANTSRFNTGLKSAESRVTRFTRSATRMFTDLRTVIAGAGAATLAGSMIKLAAEAETLTVQMEVLTGSFDKAQQVMGEVGKFAASTPFQKLEIAEAARSLLAFGSSSEFVVSELRMLGDISAATGTSLGDIAEIFGKARVQGRLFGEDINQLTGRGIPVIGALAKQFGVAESEVKKLVTEGKVGFPELQKALQSMTTDGGKFSGMMQRLSDTTAGKFSTMKDNFADLATDLGTELLPAVNQVLESMIELSRSLGGIGNLVTEVRLSFVELSRDVLIAQARAEQFGVNFGKDPMQFMNPFQMGMNMMAGGPDKNGVIQQHHIAAQRKMDQIRGIKPMEEQIGTGREAMFNAQQIALQLGTMMSGAISAEVKKMTPDDFATQSALIANQIGMLAGGALMSGIIGGSTIPIGNFDELQKAMEPPVPQDRPLQFAGAAESGTSEGYSAILAAIRPSGKSEEVKATEKQTKELIKGLAPKQGVQMPVVETLV